MFLHDDFSDDLGWGESELTVVIPVSGTLLEEKQPGLVIKGVLFLQNNDFITSYSPLHHLQISENVLDMNHAVQWLFRFTEKTL